MWFIAPHHPLARLQNLDSRRCPRHLLRLLLRLLAVAYPVSSLHFPAIVMAWEQRELRYRAPHPSRSLHRRCRRFQSWSREAFASAQASMRERLTPGSRRRSPRPSHPSRRVNCHVEMYLLGEAPGRGPTGFVLKLATPCIDPL